MNPVRKNPLEPVSFYGKHGALVFLAAEHAADLIEATREGDLWKTWYTGIPSPDGMQKEIERRLALHSAGHMLPFTILDMHGVPVGMTTFMNIEVDVPRLEIGSTWYARRVQRTALNTECKLALLSYAFETLDCLAVEFRTAFFNRQSRRAIERLGAKLDGVLRSHRHYPDGSLRDTCVYSIIQPEWPAVKQNLSFALSQHAGRSAG